MVHVDHFPLIAIGNVSNVVKAVVNFTLEDSFEVVIVPQALKQVALEVSQVFIFVLREEAV